jgi:hypothetical protein
MAEHEQNGVTIPSSEAITFPVNRDLPSSTLRVFSGEKNDRIIPTMKIIRVRRSNTLGNSNIKNLNASVSCDPLVNPNTESINQSLTGFKKRYIKNHAGNSIIEIIIFLFKFID